MSDSKKITLSYLREKYKKLRIPAIQRDYVMGAGGLDSDGKDKLDKLLNAILAKFQANEDFDFSCIITYCSNPNEDPLEIYDGQQRLTTLMLMVLYKLRIEKKSVSDFYEWYEFTERPNANDILESLTKNEESIDNIEVTDFTSFSMKNLLEKIKQLEYKDITSDYLLNHVKFDMVSIGSQNEIEQFFMDLNSGVKLKDYELYKAKLTHKVNQMKKNIILTKNKIEAFEMWSHKMDNEWLNFFDVFADYNHPVEEYEIAFVKYCIDMIFLENGEKISDKQIERITVDVIMRLYDIMQMITRLDLSFFKHKEEKDLLKGILYFSWGETDSDNIKKYNYELRGAFWKLDFEEYDKMLYYVIKFCLLDAKKSIEMKDDVPLWCFITTLDWQIDIQNEYLRLIKIILNHNVVVNMNAWYECQYSGQYLYYCKYYAYAIPQYYGKHLNNNDNIQDNIKNRHSNMFLLNKSFIQNVKISNILNRKKIAISLMEQIGNTAKENEFIENIVDLRIKLLQDYNNYDSYVQDENKVFGIVKKIETAVDEKKYYLGQVKLNWPIRGHLIWPKRGKNESLDCWVRLKCKTDFLFAEYNQFNDGVVQKTFDNDKIKEEFRKKVGEEFIDKCFWTSSDKVYKLLDRATPTSTTYNKKDSDSEKGWCRVWSLESNYSYYL